VTAKDHPIARGLQDFEIDDELYARLAGDGPMGRDRDCVLARNFRIKMSPMAWTVRHGEGRVFVTVLGHDAAAPQDAGLPHTACAGVRMGLPSPDNSAAGAALG
jgi:type 1 glutamine amidotransferase